MSEQVRVVAGKGRRRRGVSPTDKERGELRRGRVRRRRSVISDVITGVRADLAERGVPAEVLDGEEHLPRNNADGEVGQRVVFIETADTYPPLGMTGSGKNPPAKLLRAAGAVVHIWGVSSAADATPDDHRATTRTLLHQVLLAIRKAGGGSSNMGMEFTSGEWTRGGENRFGAEYVLQIVVKVPVVRAREARALARLELHPAGAGAGGGST